MERIKQMLLAVASLFLLTLLVGCDLFTTNEKPKTRLAQPIIEECRAVSTTEVFLSWSSVPNVDFYSIWYIDFDEVNSSWKHAESGIHSTSFTIRYLLDENRNYGFKVKAVGSGKFTSSLDSEVKKVKTPLHLWKPGLYRAKLGTQMMDLSFLGGSFAWSIDDDSVAFGTYSSSADSRVIEVKISWAKNKQAIAPEYSFGIRHDNSIIGYDGILSDVIFRLLE